MLYLLQMMDVPVRNPTDSVLWDEVGLACVTILYLFVWHPIAWIVAANGAVCHISTAVLLPFADRTCEWDVLCNVAIGVYANTHPCAQPVCGAMTLASVIAWRCNQRAKRRVVRSALHATLVQFPLLLSYAHFVCSCPRA